MGAEKGYKNIFMNIDKIYRVGLELVQSEIGEISFVAVIGSVCVGLEVFGSEVFFWLLYRKLTHLSNREEGTVLFEQRSENSLIKPEVKVIIDDVT